MSGRERRLRAIEKAMKPATIGADEVVIYLQTVCANGDLGALGRKGEVEHLDDDALRVGIEWLDTKIKQIE